jgi:hypothetical protein
MPRRLPAALAVLFFAVLSFAISNSAAQNAAPPAQQPGPAHQHMPPIPKPSNLQVLPKDITVPDLLKTMRGFTAALGVECQFCHASDPQTHRPNFASDANPDKAIARIMITMTRDINAKYMSQVNDPDATPADKTVTCGTCHRGKSMPAPFAATAGEHHDHPPAPAPDQKPDQKPQ